MKTSGLVWCVALLGLGGCADTGSRVPADPRCAGRAPDASVELTGTYRYLGALRGTIRLEHTGNDVRVMDTTYENADDRPLVGSGSPVGNVLNVRLVPENGDRDYEADVTFVFDEGGDHFCVEFSDTNGDRGTLGSYTGRRM